MRTVDNITSAWIQKKINVHSSLIGLVRICTFYNLTLTWLCEVLHLLLIFCWKCIWHKINWTLSQSLSFNSNIEVIKKKLWNPLRLVQHLTMSALITFVTIALTVWQKQTSRIKLMRQCKQLMALYHQWCHKYYEIDERL